VPDIDWSRPWFEHLRPFASDLPDAGTVAQRLQALASCRRLVGQPRFSEQTALLPGAAYESHIAQSNSVPTRNNLHDLLNGLMWMRHESLKRRMNQLQAAAIARDGVSERRGPLRDALTLFDENGAVWPDADPLLVEALRRRDWLGLFVQHRARWQGQHFEICGHALLEQLVRAPRKGLVAHVCVGAAPWQMADTDWAQKPFLALPVLGIPGWWPGQEDHGFYRDAQVFRAAPS
jgi:Protein of unknown function (DUF3025)